MPPHLLRCQGLAVADYSFALGRLEAGAPSTFAQLGYKVSIAFKEEVSHGWKNKDLWKVRLTVYQQSQGGSQRSWISWCEKRPKNTGWDA